MKRTPAYYTLVGGVFVWCILLVVPPLAASAGASSLAHYLYNVFSTICHQYDSRSLHIFGHKLAVCARCSGIYVGFFAGILIAPLLYAKKKITNTFRLLVVAAVPMVLDVTLDVVGLQASTLATRLFTGSFFGVVAALVLTPIIEEAISELIFKLQHVKGIRYESKT